LTRAGAARTIGRMTGEATFQDISTGPEWLVVMARMDGLPPDQAWRAWTDAEEMRRWWPQDAELDVVEGGTYHLSWPAADLHLRGHYSMIEEGRTLVFSWAWDHEPDLAERRVTVEFLPLSDGAGTQVTITQGPYSDTEADRKDRQGHLDGWAQFLPKLAGLRAA